MPERLHCASFSHVDSFLKTAACEVMVSEVKSQRFFWLLSFQLLLAYGPEPAFVQASQGLLFSWGMFSISAHIMFSNLADGISTRISGMPGTEKDQMQALISVLVAWGVCLLLQHAKRCG